MLTMTNEETLREEKATCGVCGHPMPEDEQMFMYHGYSGPCPEPKLTKHEVVAESPMGAS